MKYKRFFFSKLFLVPLVLTIIALSVTNQAFSQDTTVRVINLNDKTISESPQTNDDTSVKEKHSAKKASLYSASLPGLGQAYNHKYWKMPIIYAGFGVLGYNIHVNNKEMQEFTEAYRYKVRNDTTLTGNKYFDKYGKDDLLRGREFYRRRLELSVIFTAAWYILNVVDATVDAHFFDYDVSEDISLNIKPTYIDQPGHLVGSPGIRLCMKF